MNQHRSRRTRIGRHLGERLEERQRLSVENPFKEMSLPTTLGDAEQVSVIGDFDGDGDDDFVMEATDGNWSRSRYNGWCRDTLVRRRY